MNKQELIEKIKEIPRNEGFLVDTIEINKTWLLRELKQLEPQKPVVPQFVADWIEEAKKSCRDVFDLFEFDFTNKEVGEWFLEEKPFDLVARAWLDGYEVEKEKRYRVKMKGMNKSSTILKLDEITGSWYLGEDAEYSYTKTAHTRKELEDAGFGWVFDCEGIELEEVEE